MPRSNLSGSSGLMATIQPQDRLFNLSHLPANIEEQKQKESNIVLS